MSKTQRTADEAIDALVERVNRSRREPLCYDEVPEILRDGEPADARGIWVPWAIRPAPSPCAWIDAFEAKLPESLPRSYRSLVTRYQFPRFDVGPVKLFASTGGAMDNSWDSSAPCSSTRTFPFRSSRRGSCSLGASGGTPSAST